MELTEADRVTYQCRTAGQGTAQPVPYRAALETNDTRASGLGPIGVDALVVPRGSHRAEPEGIPGARTGTGLLAAATVGRNRGVDPGSRPRTGRLTTVLGPSWGTDRIAVPMR